MFIFVGSFGNFGLITSIKIYAKNKQKCKERTAKKLLIPQHHQEVNETTISTTW